MNSSNEIRLGQVVDGVEHTITVERDDRRDMLVQMKPRASRRVDINRSLPAILEKGGRYA